MQTAKGEFSEVRTTSNGFTKTGNPRQRRIGHDPTIAFRAPPSLVETLRTEAERRGVTSSDIGREALELFVCELANSRQDAESEAADEHSY
jgi:hypothetical protein